MRRTVIVESFNYLDPVWWSDANGDEVGLFCGIADTDDAPYLVYHHGGHMICQVASIHPLTVPDGYRVGELVCPISNTGGLIDEPVPLIGVLNGKYITVTGSYVKDEYVNGQRYMMNIWTFVERQSKPAALSTKEIGSMINRWWNDRVRSGLNPAFKTCDGLDLVGFAVPVTSHDYNTMCWCGSYTARDGDAWFTTEELISQIRAMQ